MAAEPLIDINKSIQKAPDILSCRIDNDIVMMSIEKSTYYGINAVGSRIWELLDQPRTVAGICDLLMTEYEVSPQECREHTMEFVGQLLAKDLVKQG